MVTINRYKATTIDPASGSTLGSDGSAPAPESASTVDQLRASQTEIDQFLLENGEWLDEEHLNQLNLLKQTMEWEAQVLETGGSLPSGSAGALGAANYIEKPEGLSPLWNGIPDRNLMSEDGYGMALVEDDPDRYGDFGGTVVLPNSGVAGSPTKIAFQMTDDMDALNVESRGRDLIFTATYQDGHKESWVVKDGTVRPEPIILSALGLTHGVTIDASRAMRVSDGSYQGYGPGMRSGFYLHGTEYDDVLIGSQSDDAIVGYAGNDVIDGMAGVDTIWGDEGPGQGIAGSDYVAGNFDMNYGGDDDIRGGAGDDIIYGQGGIDTVYASDVKNKESVAETETTENDIVDSAPDAASGWFTSPDGDWAINDEESASGMVVLENQSGTGGELNLTMPDGYSMAYGEKASDGSLIVTFVGDEGTFKVKIVDFFNEQFGDGDDPASGVVRLNFKGNAENNIIDFSRASVTSQVINITDDAGGDDILLGPQNALLADGVDAGKLTQSQRNTAGALANAVDNGIFALGTDDEDEDENPATADGFKATAQNGQIVITDDGVTPPDERSKRLNLCAPKGYDKAYITSDQNYLYVILVKRMEDGTAQTMVIKVDRNLGLGYNDIDVKHALSDGTYGEPLPMIAVSGEGSDYLIDGGEGSDLIFTPKGGNVYDDADDSVVEIEPSVDDFAPAATTSGSTSTSTTKETENEGDDEPETSEENDE